MIRPHLPAKEATDHAPDTPDRAPGPNRPAGLTASRPAGRRPGRGAAAGLLPLLLLPLVLLLLAWPAAPGAPATQSHTLRFYLHGTDVRGTAGGFTMAATPAPAHLLTLDLLAAPRWYSEPPVVDPEMETRSGHAQRDIPDCGRRLLRR
jgi:hypothetical protein